MTLPIAFLNKCSFRFHKICYIWVANNTGSCCGWKFLIKPSESPKRPPFYAHIHQREENLYHHRTRYISQLYSHRGVALLSFDTVFPFEVWHFASGLEADSSERATFSVLVHCLLPFPILGNHSLLVRQNDCVCCLRCEKSWTDNNWKHCCCSLLWTVSTNTPFCGGTLRRNLDGMIYRGRSNRIIW